MTTQQNSISPSRGNRISGSNNDERTSFVYSSMGPPRRRLQATAEETLTPPHELPDGHQITRVIRATGNNIYSVELPSKETLLVELPARFRSTIWMKKGSFAVVNTSAFERDNKISGEIVNIVRDEKAWRKAAFWSVRILEQGGFSPDHMLTSSI